MTGREVEKWEFDSILREPISLYVAIRGHEQYLRAPDHTEGDNEFVSTSWTYQGKSVCCVMVHSEKRAYLVMFTQAELDILTGRINLMGTGMTEQQNAAA